MAYILQTNHLTKKIDGKELVRDVGIHVKKGEIYGFLGPNGAGKTTVMKMITNLWKPTEGTVELFGQTLENTSYDMFKRMGSIIEFPRFYEQMSGRDNLKLHCEYMGYYNKERYQWGLAKLSPDEFYEFYITGEYPLKIENPPPVPIPEKPAGELGRAKALKERGNGDGKTAE